MDLKVVVEELFACQVRLSSKAGDLLELRC